MSNRIVELFKNKSKEVLNIYFTAGHPELEDTVKIAHHLDKNGADIIEIGLPYSDPLADGTTIQNSSQRALKNGISLAKILNQVQEIRKENEIPIVLMGYYNQMMQYGSERFVEDCKSAGADALIIPDLPMREYENKFKSLFEAKDLGISFLITPETSDERILDADRLSSGFIYVVSKSSITGTAEDMNQSQMDYFERIDQLKLETPRLIGFGIHDRPTYLNACKHSSGAIIGSAFIRALEQEGSIEDKVGQFVSSIR